MCLVAVSKKNLTLHLQISVRDSNRFRLMRSPISMNLCSLHSCNSRWGTNVLTAMILIPSWPYATPHPGQVRSACMPRWQPCVRAQATLYKKKHYLPVMKATNSDSKRCQVSVDVSLQSPSCFQRKKARTFSSQAKGGRPPK